MKTIATKILLTGIFASLALSAAAAEPVLSPRATQFKHELRTVLGTTPSMLVRSVAPASPKAIAFAESLRKVPGNTMDMLARGNPQFSPRAVANDAGKVYEFRLAPLK